MEQLFDREVFCLPPSRNHLNGMHNHQLGTLCSHICDLLVFQRLQSYCGILVSTFISLADYIAAVTLPTFRLKDAVALEYQHLLIVTSLRKLVVHIWFIQYVQVVSLMSNIISKSNLKSYIVDFRSIQEQF